MGCIKQILAALLGSVHKYFGGGLGKMEGGQKSFELPEGGGDQKVFHSKGRLRN